MDGNEGFNIRRDEEGGKSNRKNSQLRHLGGGGGNDVEHGHHGQVGRGQQQQQCDDGGTEVNGAPHLDGYRGEAVRGRRSAAEKCQKRTAAATR